MAQEVIEVTQREVEIIEVIERGPAGPQGSQPDINYTVVSSARTLEAADLIAADTSGGAFTLTLPANPSNGDAVDIFDFSETFDTNPLTIARNGQKIESLTEDLVCNVEGAYFTLIYTGATRGWQVLPRYGTSGGGGESVLTTQGDTLYRAVGVNARLPIGSTGQVLKVSAQGIPSWANESGAVTSVNGQTGAVTVAAAQHAAEHEAGEADEIQAMAALVDTDYLPLNGVYFHDGTLTSGRPNFFKTGTRKNTKLQWNNSTSEWELIRNLTLEAVGWGGTTTFPWTVNNWADGRDPAVVQTIAVTRLGLEDMTQKLAETGSAATATTSEDGLFSAADKTKLNGIAANATANTASSATPSALGTAAAGSATDYARADHVHSAEVSDSAFRVLGSTDATKKVAIEVDTNVPSGQTVTLTAPSASGTIALAGAAPAAHKASHATGRQAIFVGTVGGMTTAVTIQANNAGTAGNSITLSFNGTDDIDTVLAAWNSANPSNLASVVFGNGAQVPNNGTSITLSQGTAAGSDAIATPHFTNLSVGNGKTINLGPNYGQFTSASGNAGFTINRGNDSGYASIDLLQFADAGTGWSLQMQPSSNDLQIVNRAVGSTQLLLPASGTTAINTKGNIEIADTDNGTTGTLVAHTNLTASRTYDLPDRSGELMIVGDAPASHTHGNLTNDGKLGSTSGLPVVTTTAGAVTTLALGTANQVLRVNSGATGVEFADPAVTSVTGTAPIVSSGGTTPAISIQNSPTLTGDVTINGASTGVAGSLKVGNTTGSFNRDVEIGGNGIVLRNVGGSGTTTIALGQGGTNNYTLTPPAASGTIALTSNTVSSVSSSASDVLGVSGSNITGVDAGAADRLVFWDDSANRLTYLEAGSGLTISGTVMTASGGASINQAIAVGFVLN